MEVTSVKGGDSLIRHVTGMNRAIKDEDEPLVYSERLDYTLTSQTVDWDREIRKLLFLLV